MIAHTLTAIGLLTAYAALVLISPVGRCIRCHGERVIRRGSRAKPCRWCHATGKRRRPGATLVHRLAWTILLSHLMERRRERKDT